MLGCSVYLVGPAWTVDPCYNDIILSASAEGQHAGTAASICNADAEALVHWGYGIFESEDVYMTPVDEDDPDNDVKPSGMSNRSRHS